MADFVLLDGDQVEFVSRFGDATVVVEPGVIQGTADVSYRSKSLCLEGDEERVLVEGCRYVSGAFNIAGVGRLKIKRLGANQVSQKMTFKGRHVLLKGHAFEAVFEVQQPASQLQPPGRPLLDPVKSYQGQGNFRSANRDFKTD